jgi:hypothetical protein
MFPSSTTTLKKTWASTLSAFSRAGNVASIEKNRCGDTSPRIAIMIAECVEAHAMKLTQGIADVRAVQQIRIIFKRGPSGVGPYFKPKPEDGGASPFKEQ